MRSPETFRCNFHGVMIEIKGPESTIASVRSRLGQFGPTIVGSPEIQCRFDIDDSINSHKVEKPIGPSRAFYTPTVGEALYFPDTDELYLDYGGRVRTLCQPVDGLCLISVVEPEIDQLWLATHPILTIPLIEMLKRRNKFNIHAAAFAIEDQCVLLPGTTGAGKSTLTIALLRAGYDFLGDDMAFFDPLEWRLLAFPENVDITDTTVSFFPELASLLQKPKQAGWPKYEANPRDYFPTTISWSAHPRAIVFPRISTIAESTLTQMTKDEAFLELAPNVLLTERTSTQAHFSALAKLVQSTPSYRLNTARDFDRIPQIIREVLG